MGSSLKPGVVEENQTWSETILKRGRKRQKGHFMERVRREDEIRIQKIMSFRHFYRDFKLVCGVVIVFIIFFISSMG